MSSGDHIRARRAAALAFAHAREGAPLDLPSTRDACSVDPHDRLAARPEALEPHVDEDAVDQGVTDPRV